MKLYVKYNIPLLCKSIVEEQCNKLGINYTMHNYTELDLTQKMANSELQVLIAALKKYGIEIVESEKSILIQKIKDLITELIYSDKDLPSTKTSNYLAKKLNVSYAHLSNLFSEVTFTTLENYIILQKIERVKHLISTESFTFNEIAWKLNYSSLAHLSTQFKNKTGLTLSAFKRIISKRKETIQ